MIPIKQDDGGSFLKCRSCGAKINKPAINYKIKESVKKSKDIAVIEKDTIVLPTTEKDCPKCDHGRAYWWLQQTRSADEPPTQFFRCVKCNYTWREYK